MLILSGKDPAMSKLRSSGFMLSAVCLAVTSIALVGAAKAAAPTSDLAAGMKLGKVELKSIGPLSFGPQGILFVGDPKAARRSAREAVDARSSRRAASERAGNDG